MGVPAGLGATLLLLAALLATGEREARSTWLDPAARRGAEETVRLFATLSAHLLSSGGDRRFAERLPAEEWVVEEQLASAAWPDRVVRGESSRLDGIELLGMEPTGVGTVEVKAVERWTTSWGEGEGASSRSDDVAVRYALRRDAGRWRVVDWTISPGGFGDGQERSGR